MISILAVAFLGFFLGMRHATDPDHVIAIAAIVSREKDVRRAVRIGVLWGLGHTLTILLVGGAIILFDLVIPPRLGLTMELSVGLMLVLLGVLNLAGMNRWIGDNLVGAGVAPKIHSHPHAHGDYVHRHPHGHEPEAHGHAESANPQARLDRRFGRLASYRAIRPVVVGVVHGLAGSAAVALLVLATIRDTTWAVAYLVVFGVGTVAGMMLITAAIGLPFAYTSGSLLRINRYLALAAGLASLAFGLFVIYRIGFVQGLFTGSPRWTPK